MTKDIDMSHFYRLHTHNNCSPEDMLILRSPYRQKQDGLGFGKFNLESSKNPILLEPSWPHCKMYKGPLMDAMYEQDFIVDMRSHKEIPDVISDSELILVSDKAKHIIEQFDDFGHQFYETRFFNEQGEVVNQSPYFVMIIRRVLHVEELNQQMDREALAFDPTGVELRFLSTILLNPTLKANIAKLPWWRPYMKSNCWYLSEGMLNALRDAGITGLNDYSHKYSPKTGESISKV
jgi:hypothetical protein